MSVIAIALKHLIAAGVSGVDLVRAVAEMEAAQPVTTVDPVAEKRRAYDRERKREAKRALSTGIPPESVETAEAPPSLDKETSPRPPKEIKPIPRVNPASALPRKSRWVLSVGRRASGSLVSILQAAEEARHPDSVRPNLQNAE